MFFGVLVRKVSNYKWTNHLEKEKTAISIPKAFPVIDKSLIIKGKLGTTSPMPVNAKKILI